MGLLDVNTYNFDAEFVYLNVPRSEYLEHSIQDVLDAITDNGKIARSEAAMHKLHCIKRIHDSFKIGLTESKNIIDNWYQNHPDWEEIYKRSLF